MTDKQLVFGFHSITMLLQRMPARVKKIFIVDGRHDQRVTEIIHLAEIQKITVQTLSRQELDKRLPQAIHQGIAAECLPTKDYQEDDLIPLIDQLKEPALLLILDGIEDPHNLGACFRTADAAGVHAIIAPRDHSASLSPSARKVASGAAEVIPFIQVTNLARCLRLLKELDIRLVGTAIDAPKTLFQSDLRGHLGLILGSEGKGMRRLTKENCDELISLPMQGFVSSLNVSVSAGVCLYEALRQRQYAD